MVSTGSAQPNGPGGIECEEQESPERAEQAVSRVYQMLTLVYRVGNLRHLHCLWLLAALPAVVLCPVFCGQVPLFAWHIPDSDRVSLYPLLVATAGLESAPIAGTRNGSMQDGCSLTGTRSSTPPAPWWVRWRVF